MPGIVALCVQLTYWLDIKFLTSNCAVSNVEIRNYCQIYDHMSSYSDECK